jgi:hypothetical protein
METVFRFVTVRNPRKPTQEEEATGFIRYDADLEAPLIEGLMEQMSQGDRDEALRLLKAYREQQEFLNTPARLQEHAPSLYEWADWLSRNATYLTVRQYQDFRNAVELEVSRQQVATLWDNLVAYTYAGGRPEVRESIIWMLRAVHLNRFDGELDDALVRRLAQATVLIPAEAHIGVSGAARSAPEGGSPSYLRSSEGGSRRMALRSTGRGVRSRPSGDESWPEDHPETSASEPPEPSSTLIDPEALRRIERLRAASNDLLQAYKDEVERGRAEPPHPLRTPRITPEGSYDIEDEEPVKKKGGEPASQRFEDRVYNRVSGETRKALEELKLSPNLRIPYALQRLQSEASRLGRAAVRGGMASRRIYRAGGAFWTYDPAGPSPAAKYDPKVLWRGDEPYVDFFSNRECMITPLGVADFRRVEQELCCYEPGEVAHVENVLIGESRERTTRRLRRTEELISLVTEEETTTEKDNQTTDRFELQKETNKQVEFDLSLELGVQVAGSYGPVSITADTNFSTSLSTSESDRQATTYANEVTTRALERLRTNVREERTTRTIEEFEETNRHGYDNTGGNAHIVGLYRWLDKVYEAKVVNYGKRMMLEFMIPEPAAFHLLAMTEPSVESGVTLEKPIDPRSSEISSLGLSPLTNHELITEFNYYLYSAAYGARVDSPPASVSTVSKAYNREAMDQNTQFSDSKNDLALTAGYEASRAIAPFGIHSEVHDGGPNWITIAIGQKSQFSTGGGTFNQILNGEDGTVSVVLMGRTRFYAINVEIECTRTDAEFTNWQIKTFNAIIDAYNTQLAAYNNALAEAKAAVGLQIRGTNPAINRQVEATELKKGAIRLMAQHCAPLWSNSVKEPGECDYPEFDCCEAIRDGSYVQFVEQALEWKLITYLFYPYFWGRKCNWKKIYQLEDVDPLFLGFLQAGYARVVVPIRPGYESAILRFLADGAIWNGGAAPGVDSEMYVSMENEMKEPVGEMDPNIEPWPVRVPTTLVALQCESGCIPGSGLPCPCEDEDNS